MLYYSVFLIVSGSVNHSILYTLIAEIILRYSNQTVQVRLTMSGPKRRQHDAMRKCHARATYLATQRNVHWHGQYMHALMSSHYCSCIQS